MVDLGYFEIAAIVVFSILSCLVAVWLLLLLYARKPQVQLNKNDPVCFLFDGEDLIDASISGYSMLGTSNLSPTLWQHVGDLMRPRFSNFPSVSDLSEGTGKISSFAKTESDNGRIDIEWWGEKIRVELFEEGRDNPLTQHNLALSERELGTLRNAVQGAPYPIWQTNASGGTTWTNASYETLVDRIGRPKNSGERLFALETSPNVEVTRSRTALQDTKRDAVSWYEISTVLFGEHRMNYAIDVTAIVTAETAQRNFVQTLTKTFANLSIGLAIFDRNRQLALFNPSLIDLTALPADFLSARPNMLSFFDNLRDNRMMPEPKNYSSWREQLAGVIAAASDGLYSETWALASGQTYRVTGRPHPDGAIAFLFEDISAEISLAQGFRAQLELGQSVLDHDENALAIFSSSGSLVLSNTAYQELWSVDPDNSFATVNVHDACQHWRLKCADPNAAEGLKDAVLTTGTQTCSSMVFMLKSGARLNCLTSRLPQGNVMIKFRAVPLVQTPTLSSARA